MVKAKIVTLQGMSDEQTREDISMTPLERLHIAFQISDFALELHPHQEVIKEEPSSINWIVLHKISS